MKRSSKGIVITILVVALIALSVYGISQRNQQMLNAVEVKTAKVEKEILYGYSQQMVMLNQNQNKIISSSPPQRC